MPRCDTGYTDAEILATNILHMGRNSPPENADAAPGGQSESREFIEQ